jgi:hypothetical protein
VNKVVLSNAAQLIDLLKANPALMEIPVFAGLKSTIDTINTSKASCNCSNKANARFQKIQNVKPSIDAALRNLTPTDMLTIKTTLKLDQFCYYDRSPDTGRMELKCL